MKIGIYGGTFNPPHKAHLRIAESFFDEIGFSKLLVVPSAIPPHKQSDYLATQTQRLEMCKLLFKDEKFAVSDLELKRQGRSYTVDTLKELRKTYPTDDFYLIIGSDMLLSFHKWYCYEEILKNCSLCVMTRENEISHEIMENYAAEVLKMPPDKLIISSFSALEMSSTEIRSKIKNGEDVSYYLTKEVEAYIAERGLYL